MLLLAACVARGGGQGAVGVSDKPSAGGTKTEIKDAGLIDGAGSLPAGYRSSFAKLNKARLVSQGHAAGRWEVDIWANELAQKALATRAKDVPVGAIVVSEHYERNEGKTAGPVMVMEKRPPGFAREHGDWRWAVIGSQGQLVKDGVIEQCAGCHDDAPMDGLFPIVE
jgi:hypothetical protein